MEATETVNCSDLSARYYPSDVLWRLSWLRVLVCLVLAVEAVNCYDLAARYYAS